MIVREPSTSSRMNRLQMPSRIFSKASV